MNTRRRRWIVGILAAEMVCICICALYLLRETKEPSKLIWGSETPAYSAEAKAEAEAEAKENERPIMLATELAVTPPAEGEETFDPILIQQQLQSQISGSIGVMLGFASTDRAKPKQQHHYPHPSPTPKAETDPALEAAGDSLFETLPSSTDPVMTVANDAVQEGDALSTDLFASSDVLPPPTDPIVTVVANNILQKGDALSTLPPDPITTVTNKTLQNGDILSRILGPLVPATTLPDPNVREVQASVLDRVVASQLPATDLTRATGDVSAGRLQNLINDAHSLSTGSIPVSNVAGSATSRAPVQALTSQSFGSVPSATSLSSTTRSIPLTNPPPLHPLWAA